jgi:hypothetical protein
MFLWDRRWSFRCLTGLFEFRQDTGEQHLDRFREVLGDVKAIGHLHGLRRPARCRCRVVLPPIPAHPLDFRMGAHPSGCRFHLPIG